MPSALNFITGQKLVIRPANGNCNKFILPGPTADASIQSMLTENACVVGAVACDTVPDDSRQIERKDDALSAVSKNVTSCSILCATTGISLQMSDYTTAERVRNRTISEEATPDNKPKR